MKIIRKRRNANNKLLFIVLLFAFFCSGLIRNAIVNSSNFVSIETCHALPFKQKQFSVVSVEDLNDYQEVLFKKTHTNLNDLLLVKKCFVSIGKMIVFDKKETNFKLHLFYLFLKLPLYDLFCNWKYHLSL